MTSVTVKHKKLFQWPASPRTKEEHIPFAIWPARQQASPRLPGAGHPAPPGHYLPESQHGYVTAPWNTCTLRERGKKSSFPHRRRRCPVRGRQEPLHYENGTAAGTGAPGDRTSPRTRVSFGSALPGKLEPSELPRPAHLRRRRCRRLGHRQAAPALHLDPVRSPELLQHSQPHQPPPLLRHPCAPHPPSPSPAQPSGFLKGLEYLEKLIPLSLPGLGSWSPLACGEVRDLALGKALLGLLFPPLYSTLLLSHRFHPCCVSKDKGNKRT